MKITLGSFMSTDGTKLSTLQYHPEPDSACNGSSQPAAPKALCFFFHGIGSHLQPIQGSRWEMMAQHLYKCGIHCYGMEYKGHGLSDGLPCYIDDFDRLIQDGIAYMDSIRQQAYNVGLPCFVIGESMGGAVVVQLSKKTKIDGMILLAPMCKINPSMIPPKPITWMLTRLASWFPAAPLIPASTKFALKCRNNEMELIYVMYDSIRYNGNHRLKTSLECVNVCNDIHANLPAITTPFLLIHGLNDTVTDPLFSKQFYPSTPSMLYKDLLLLPDTPHSLFTNPDTGAVILDKISTWVRFFVK